MAQAILRYLSQHPDASDTIDGIRQFWFPDWPAVVSERVVLEALQELVSDRLVVESTSRAAKNRYGANRDRLRDPGKG